MHLFTYGTLMFAEVWESIVERQFKSQPAVLAHHAAYFATGEVFPVLMAESGTSTRGLVYFDLDDATLATLDEFESGFYDRVSVQAALHDGEIVPCQAYVLPDVRRKFASSRRWDADWFNREALARYLQRLQL